MPVRTLPDVEAVVTAHLRASAEVQDLTGGGAPRVGTELYAGDTAALKVTLISGEERLARHLDAARIQLDAYGGTKAQARTLIATARAVLVEMPSTHAGGVVTDIRTLVTPWWNPDTGFEPARPRYTADLEIVLHPTTS